AGWRGDVHARMRGARLAVVHALVAETSTDAPFDRTHEGFGEIAAVVIALAHDGDGRLFTADALGDRGWRIDRRWRHAIDMFDRPVAWRYPNLAGKLAAVRTLHLDLQRPAFIATDAKRNRAICGHAQAAPGVLDMTAGGHLADHHRALRGAVRKDHALIGGCGPGRKRQGQQGREDDDAHRDQRSKARRWPRTLSSSLPSFQASWPLTKVAAMLERKVSPSNGDQPHFERISVGTTVCGRSGSTMT